MPCEPNTVRADDEMFKDRAKRLALEHELMRSLTFRAPGRAHQRTPRAVVANHRGRTPLRSRTQPDGLTGVALLLAGATYLTAVGVTVAAHRSHRHACALGWRGVGYGCAPGIYPLIGPFSPGGQKQFPISPAQTETRDQGCRAAVGLHGTASDASTNRRDCVALSLIIWSTRFISSR